MPLEDDFLPPPPKKVAKIDTDSELLPPPPKKKEPTTQPLSFGYKSATEASLAGGLPKQENISQSPLVPKATTTKSVSTKSQWTPQQQKDLVERIKSGNLTAETPQEQDYLSRIGDRMVRGMNTLNQNLAKTPEFIYNIAAMPQNIIAEKFDIPSLAVSAEKVKKDLGITNELADYYKDKIDQLAYLDEKYVGANGSVTQLVKNGNYKDAAKLLGEQIAESLPTTAAIAVSGGLGATPSAITLSGGAVFGAGKYDELADRTDLSESEKTAISLSTGLVEGLIENIGTANLGRVAKEIFTKNSADVAKQEIKKSFVTAYKEALKKYMPISGAISEGIEEAGTQFAQNAIDIYGGVDPNKKLTDGLMDALIVGTGSGAVISAPTLLSKKRNEEVNKKKSDIEQIDTEIQNPNISENAKITLVQARQEKMAEINDILEQDIQEQKAIPEENKREIEALNDVLSNIEQDIQQSTTYASKALLEAKKQDIENQVDILSKPTTNEAQKTEELQPSGESEVSVLNEQIPQEPIKEEENLNKQDNAIQIKSATSEVSRNGETRENQPESSKGVRPSEQGQEVTQKSETEKVIAPPVVEQTTTDVGGETSPDVSKALSSVEETAKALEEVELPNTFVSQDKGGILNRENYYRLAQHKFQDSKGLTTEDIFDKNKQREQFKTEKGRLAFQKEFEQFAENPINKKQIISEAYHQAKADGSNPELVQAVESLLGKPSESARKGDNLAVSETTTTKTDVTPTETKEVVTEKVSEKPTKIERKAIAEAKVDEIADKVKSFADKYLAAKGIEGAKKAGFGDQNKVIDVIAGAVKTLVTAGIEIDEAIKQVRAFLDEEYDTTSIKDFEVKQAIARDELTDYAKEKGYSSYREAVFAVNKYVREVGKEDVITKEDIDKAVEAKKPQGSIEVDANGRYKTKSLVKAIREFEGMPKSEQDRIIDYIGELYEVQSRDELTEIGKALLDEFGADAVKQALDPRSGLPSDVRLSILGQHVLDLREQEKKAKTETEKNKLAQEQNDIWDYIDNNLLRQSGRTIDFIKQIYDKSPLARVKKIIKDVQKINDLYAPENNKKATNIKQLIESSTELQESINQAVEEALGETNKTISALEKEIADLRKELTKSVPKGSSKNPFKVKITDNAIAKEKLKKLLSKSYSNPMFNPEFIADMAYISVNAIENGFVKIGEFYLYMNKALKGKYNDSYGDFYEIAKKRSIEQGADEKSFSSEEEIRSEIDKIRKESAAEKLTKLTALKAKAALKRAQQAHVELAKKIREDLTNLDTPSTTKERDALSKVIATLRNKAKEYAKAKKVPVKENLSDLIKFAFENQEQGDNLWDAAQKEVFAMIDNDTNLTEDEKQTQREFLDKYKSAAFDILLTKGQKDRIIREKLIELGYAKQVAGNVVLDLSSLMANEKNVGKAVDKLAELISKETGISGADLDLFKASITARLKDIIVEKKEAKLNAYLKQNEAYNAARLIGYKPRKTKVQKLLELYNAGALTDAKVKEVLFKELGIIEFTKEDEKWLEDKFTQADEAPTGAEREKIEEEIQAFIESKDASWLNKDVVERMKSRLLMSPLTFVKNMSGFIDTAAMALQQFILSNKNMVLDPKRADFDANVFKILANSRKIAMATGLDVLINGGVDLGTAFSEITESKEGTPRVRRMEYYKPRFKDLYVELGGKKLNINVYNSLLRAEKYAPRLLNFADTFNQIALQEMRTYTFYKNQLMVNDPTMSEKEASQKAYDMIVGEDLLTLAPKIKQEFKERGIALDMNKATDRARFNRRLYEAIAQTRDKEATKKGAEFAGRYTYKVSDVGIFPAAAVALAKLKALFLQLARTERNKSKTQSGNEKFIREKFADYMERMADVIISAKLPFIKGVALILEKGLEMNPYYGGAKSAYYLGSAGFSKLMGSSPDVVQDKVAKSGEVAYRALLGLVITSLLLSISDDDEEGKPMLYGEGDESYAKQQAIKTLRKPNTITIGGRDINLDYFGSAGVALKVKAALLDLERYSEKYANMDGIEKLAMQTLALARTILLGSYTQGMYDLAGMATGKSSESKNDKLVADILTRTFIPFTSASRMLMNTIDPKAKKPIGFLEELAKQSGLVAGWMVDRPAYDYRGRQYNTGQLYSSSPDAFGEMFIGGKKLADDLDKRIMKDSDWDMSYTQIQKANKLYYVTGEDGKKREMTNLEAYEVGLEKNKLFDEKVREHYRMMDLPEFEGGYSDDLKKKYSTKEGAKEILGKLNGEAKKEAFVKLFNEYPVSDNNDEEEIIKAEENKVKYGLTDDEVYNLPKYFKGNGIRASTRRILLKLEDYPQEERYEKLKAYYKADIITDEQYVAVKKQLE